MAMPQDTEGTVYCVDRDRVTQARLAQVLAAQGLSFRPFASAEGFLDSDSQTQHDTRESKAGGCLVLEVELPGMSGLDLQAALAARGSTLPIIFLSSTRDMRAPIRALKSGALDFLLKPMEPLSLAESVRNALALDARNRQAYSLRAQIMSRMGELTEREAEVMGYVVRGHTSKEIAHMLCISPRTVEVHRKNLFSKMRAESLAGLVEQVIQVREMPDAAGRARPAISAQLRDSTYLTRAGNV